MNSKLIYLLCFGLGFLACYITFRIINKPNGDSAYTEQIKASEERILVLRAKWDKEKLVSDSLRRDAKVLEAKIEEQKVNIITIKNKYAKEKLNSINLSASDAILLLSKNLSE